ncbi:MAG TPA: hypothetical protein VEU11_12295, partial [Terriglobales bacterium]|nr:hypothetical protein [Terriglobales bacterium]
MTVHLSENDVVTIGDVKIMQRGQHHGFTPLPEKPFSGLGENYCSLGQAFSYYEALVRLGPKVYRPLLRGLGDVTIAPARLAAFEDEHAFQTSLLRSSAAALALKDAPVLVGIQKEPMDVPGDLQFSFKTRVGGTSFVINFDFGT